MTDFRAPLTIAVDGPSGSGKSTASRRVARELGISYLDTGAMYRALTWWCLDRGLDLGAEEDVAAEAATFPLEMVTDPDAPGVRVGGRRIDDEIRAGEISTVVSRVATNLAVRSVLQQRQRDLLAAEAARTGGCVAEGRDITTVVAPDADVRVLLVADEDERLRRRAAELHGTSDEPALAATRDQVLRRDADDATVSRFRTAADGVVTIDSSQLAVDEVVAAVLSLVPGADDEDDALGRSLRAGLDDYDLDDEDQAILAGDWDDDEPDAAERRLPVLAVVGRPNVGKSTFVNRVIGRREAVVEDRPGVTRDRVFYPAEWAGTDFLLVDTGGWEPKTEGLRTHVAQQAELAIDLADAILFVVDANTGITAADEQMVKVLRRAKKPVVLAANKVDDERGELEAAALWNLGLGEPHPVSALHGRGSGDLLDVAVAALPEEGSVFGPAGGPRRVALIGRPNVGKSSLLNRLAGAERVVVDEVAGTTRDPVDELVELGGKPWRFVDTAGIRKRFAQAQGAEFYASLRTRAALEKAEVAVVLLEASEPISVQDLKIIDLVIESGRSLVLAFNKWDLLDAERHAQLETEIEKDLAHVAWAPRVNVSAETGWHVGKLVAALETSLASWDLRIPTGRLNAVVGRLVAAHPHPLRGGKQPRILFVTQARTRPPRFVIFASGFLEHGYRRFIERRLRETFDFRGSPIAISARIREKRGRK